MGKTGIAPGQKLPKGAYFDRTGKLVLPPNPPKVKVIVIRLPRSRDAT
jgi:hypothetical protein